MGIKFHVLIRVYKLII